MRRLLLISLVACDAHNDAQYDAHQTDDAHRDARRDAHHDAQYDSSQSPCPPVTLLGTPDVPTSVVLHNGIARVSFPGDDGIGELARHRLELLTPTGWRHANERRYGDWTFYTSPFQGEVDQVNVVINRPDYVVVSYVWKNHTFDRPRPTGGCYLPLCGVGYRDIHGAIIYDYNRIPRPPVIEGVTFWKTVGMRQCEPGYYVGYSTDPPLAWGSWNERRLRENSLGEREIGLGFIAGVTWASSGVIARSPGPVQITDLGIPEQAVGPWWFATVPRPSSENIRVLPFLSMEHPLESFHVQWSPGENGTPMVHQMVQQLGPDGRPERFQVFIGAVVYESPDLSLEPTDTARAMVNAALPSWEGFD